MKLKRYVCICTETSGIEEDAELIKLDAIKFVNGKIQKTFSHYVKAEKEISKKIFDICELDPNYYYENARDRDETLKEFKKFLGKSVIIGYHLNFDLKYITRYIEIKNSLLDLLKIVRKKMRHCPINKVEKKYHINEKNECILFSKLFHKLNKGISYKDITK